MTPSFWRGWHVIAFLILIHFWELGDSAYCTRKHEGDLPDIDYKRGRNRCQEYPRAYSSASYCDALWLYHSSFRQATLILCETSDATAFQDHRYT